MKYKIGDVVICHNNIQVENSRNRGYGWIKDRIFEIDHISGGFGSGDVLWPRNSSGVFSPHVRLLDDTADNFNKRAFRS